MAIYQGLILKIWKTPTVRNKRVFGSLTDLRDSKEAWVHILL